MFLDALILFFFSIRTPVNINTIGVGMIFGWPSASFPELQSETEPPLPSGPLTIEQISWVGAYMCIGNFFGNFFFNWLSENYGRKISLISTAIPQLVSAEYNNIYSLR